MAEFDAIDAEILRSRMEAFDKIEGPRLGDHVDFANGITARIAYIWDNSIQTTDGGAFNLGEAGISMSGTLYEGVPPDTLTATDEIRDGAVWFFHHDMWQAHNGVHTMTPLRVFTCSLPAPGGIIRRRARSPIDLSELGDGVLYRGAAELPHQAQRIRRDLHGETILTRPGARARGAIRPAYTSEWTRRVWNNQYSFVVYKPGHAGTNWTAFRDEQELRDFANAYAITIDGLLTAPTTDDEVRRCVFELVMPEDDTDWQPVRVVRG